MPPVPAGRSAAKERDRLLGLLTPVVQQAGYDLEDISVTAAGRRNLVRLVVDRDGGIDLDAVADVSRAVSAVLDGDGDAFAGPYVLEVSSPGVDRPLTEPRHWRRATGRLVTVPVGERSLTGRVAAVSDTGVRLESDDGGHDVAWHSLGAGQVKVEFTHADAAADAREPVDTLEGADQSW